MRSTGDNEESRRNVSELIKTSTSTRTASNAALVCGERRVSYEEFAARVADLARGLIAAGVGPEVPVGVEIDRSVELLVAVHAVVAAGGHYVPLDPSPVSYTHLTLPTNREV